MSKYTPGPWEVARTAHGEAGLSILYKDRSSNAQWVKWEMARVGLNSRKITEKTEANARLIAAAPDMLEALKKASTQLWASYEVTGGSHGDGIGKETAEMIDAVIAKAEGKK